MRCFILLSVVSFFGPIELLFWIVAFVAAFIAAVLVAIRLIKAYISDEINHQISTYRIKRGKAKT